MDSKHYFVEERNIFSYLFESSNISCNYVIPKLKPSKFTSLKKVLSVQCSLGFFVLIPSQLIFICSNSALETLEKDVKYVHMSSTLNKSHTFF